MSRNGKNTGGVFARILNRMKSPLTSTHPTLLAQEPFERALERERARAERGRHSFAFARLRFPSEDRGKNGYNQLLAQLAKVVGKRMRFTDLTGVYEEEVGIVLVNTPIWAIEDIVKDIEIDFNKRIARHMGQGNGSLEIACDIFYAANDKDSNTLNYRKEEFWQQLRT